MTANLDNTGDTIIDVVLTETGKRQLAAGNFNVTSFGLGDDEINYVLYDPSVTPSDTDLLLTPVREANPDSIAALQHNLMSLDLQDYVFLPTATVVTTAAARAGNDEVSTGQNAGYRVLLTDQTSVDKFTSAGVAIPAGYQEAVYDGTIAAAASSETGLVIDYGITQGGNEGYTRYDEPEELMERYYLVQLDNRFLKLLVPSEGVFEAASTQTQLTTANTAPNIGTDDQNIRTYELIPSSNPTFFKRLDPLAASPKFGSITGLRTNWKLAPTALLRRSLEAWTSGRYPTTYIDDWFTNVDASLTGDAIVLDTSCITKTSAGCFNISYIRLVKAV